MYPFTKKKIYIYIYHRMDKETINIIIIAFHHTHVNTVNKSEGLIIKSKKQRQLICKAQVRR